MSPTKASPQDLAIYGGPPAFAQPLHVGRPNLPDRGRFLARVQEVFDRCWLTNDGPLVGQFERAIASMLGVKHCVAVCNGTLGLQLAIRALGLTGEVILPSMTFIATAHALAWQGVTPVFCDIDPDTHHLDPRRIEALITPATTGILGVHLWGRPCDVDALGAIARRHNLRLLFDAAHAFACGCGGRPLGGFGDAEVFSFHGTKFLNTLEGGAITTNNDVLADQLRRMRNFGFAGPDRVTALGINAKMNEISAAMGLSLLEEMERLLEVNRRNWHLYRQQLAGLPGLTLLQGDGSATSNYQYVVAMIDQRRFGISRDRLLQILHAENVLARRYFYPGCHCQEPYRSWFTGNPPKLPVTDRVAEEVLVFPTGTGITAAQIVQVCQLVKLAFRAERAAA